MPASAQSTFGREGVFFFFSFLSDLTAKDERDQHDGDHWSPYASSNGNLGFLPQLALLLRLLVYCRHLCRHDRRLHRITAFKSARSKVGLRHERFFYSGAPDL